MTPPPARQHREAGVVVVAAGFASFRWSSDVGRAAELAAPDDERVVEQAARLQVGEQGGGGAVAVGAELRWPLVVVGVGVPGLFVVLRE